MVGGAARLSDCVHHRSLARQGAARLATAGEAGGGGRGPAQPGLPLRPSLPTVILLSMSGLTQVSISSTTGPARPRTTVAALAAEVY